MTASKDWWRGAVIYQVYPRSFKDTNGDGIGDLKGIAEKLDYIAGLGVDAVWISPFLKSPMKDFGYDVSDYRDVDPLFGTLEDFRALLDKAHRLNLKIIMDMVFSHTSDQHPWFIESHQSRDNPKADWYVWADPKEDGTPPNNWVSVFGGSSWQYDSWRGQYYLHNFLTSQPDLNVHNADVQKEILDTMKFWLEFGIDGFRLDAINFSMHDRSLKDNPARPIVDGAKATQLDFPDPYSMQWHKYDKSQPEMLPFLERMRALVDQYPGTMLLGEVGDDDEVGCAIEYSSPGRLHTCYNFSLIGAKPKSAEGIRNAVQTYQSRAQGKAWPSWAFSNHDVVRAVSRWSEPYGHDPRVAKLLIAMTGCLRGSAFLYQGEELGLPETRVEFADIQDPWGKYLYPKWQGRDGCRTPMPWLADAPDFGFSNGKSRSWLPVNDGYARLAADRQQTDSHSTLNFTRAFLAWRRTVPALIDGDLEFIETETEQVLGFRRAKGDQIVYAFFNTQDSPCRLQMNGLSGVSAFQWEGQSATVQGEAVELSSFGFFIK